MNLRRPASVLAIMLCVFAASCSDLERLSTEEALDRLTVATSKVYDAKGNVIANLHGEINREPVKLTQIPRHVRDAVIAVEDERFWKHQGIDVRSITRAALKNFRAEAGTQGGSTISQQLAKNLYFPRPARTIARKLDEARVTWQLEREYTKTQILEMYLNTIYLGRGVYGVETAARSYFDKPVSELTLPEGAFLAGLIHEPARYEWKPSDPPERRRERAARAEARRNHVIDRMHRVGLLSEARAEQHKDARLDVRPAEEQRWKHPYFVDLVLRQLGVLSSPKLDPRFDFLGTDFEERSKNVYRRGLKIYTTLDPRAQTGAEEAVEVLPGELERLSVALAAIEPTTGYIRALVGGRDYYPDCEEKKDEDRPDCLLAKVNLALGNAAGGSGRQPGSSFKPFVLAAALSRGVPLYQTFPSGEFTQPIEGSEPWKVGNYEGGGGGNLTLVDGTARSVNAVFAHLEIDGVGDGDPLVGSKRVAETARRLGIGFATPDELKDRCGKDYMKENRCIPAESVPAVALGAKEVAPLDMASAYSAFANDGKRMEPTAIVRIDDATGRTLYEAEPSSLQAVPRGVARGVTYALQQVIARGTGTRAKINRPAAGKTGTSQLWRDAWFAGYTPQLAGVVWVGNPCPHPCTGIESMIPSNGYPTRIVGGFYPSMIWNAFMTDALKGVPKLDFEEPPQILFRGGSLRVEESPDPSASPGASPEEAVAGTVPSVIGQSFGDAGFDVRSAGYESNAVRGCDPSGDSDLHEVYAQSPEGGTQAPEGSTVTFYYEAGNCD
jgi:penicillin-binding protein 1A